jgi:autotransporter-associated beta strand protein
MVAAYALNNNSDVAQAAFEQSQRYFGAKAKAEGLSLHDYANQTVLNEGSFVNADGNTVNVNVFNNNRFHDHDKLKKQYTFRLTYGLPQSGDKTLAPVVPKGAEALLKTRQPYLTAAQRRAVLATTEVASGYPMLDKTNGWGRLNLVAASDGYGAFDGDVNVTMNANNGGYSELDWWRNDISGEGKLTKAGSGKLVLTGNNSYSGGTLLKEGVLAAQSASAFGNGDLYNQGGTIEVDGEETLKIGGSYTQKTGTLEITLDGNKPQIAVKGNAFITDGQLILKQGTSTISVGDRFTLIKAKGGVSGQFSNVTLHGRELELEYTSKKIIATVVK